MSIVYLEDHSGAVWPLRKLEAAKILLSGPPIMFLSTQVTYAVPWDKIAILAVAIQRGF